MTRYAIAFIHCMLLGASLAAHAQPTDLPILDFEAGLELSHYKLTASQNTKVDIVKRDGPEDTGHCVRTRNLAPGPYAGIDLPGPVPMRKNLTLSFDHRAEIEPGKEGQYLGIILTDSDNNEYWTSDVFSSEWRRVEIPVGGIRPSKSSTGAPLRLGTVISSIRLYARSKDRTPARMTAWFDNVRLFCVSRKSALSDKLRVSYANPPILNWPRIAAKQTLQYSTALDFAGQTTAAVQVSRSYYVPDKLLQPGTWYWRVWSDTELYEGWSDIERVEIPAEAHRFSATCPPADTLAKRSRPRLLETARMDDRLHGKDTTALVKTAEGIHKRGVPPHPGPYQPGNPEWRAWVEWYGKVAGKITGGTGQRLETIGKIAMLTRDPQVIQWAKELALKACEWDPEGGSAMKHGDIGAHHLLRGLNHAYDACYEALTPQERTQMRNIIAKRAEQFASYLDPFRGHEANNHAWLQALGLAESGIVLAGQHDKAAEWVDYVMQLYIGRFLCCLGYQGDNNEGLTYWGYGLGFVIDYADMMKAVCGIDLYKHPWLRQTARFPMYCALPNGWGVSFADTGMPNHGVLGPTQSRFVKKLALRTGDPYALWYSGETQPVDGLTPRPPTDLPPSIHYRHIGWVIFNTTLVDGLQAVTVAMHSGKYYAGHQHPDQNSFVIHAYGEKLAIDGGYYDWYGSPHFKGYSACTAAHNTLLVNGQGQQAFKHGADGNITSYFDSPPYGFTIGDASNPTVYAGLLKRFDRRVLFVKPHFVFIHDLVTASQGPATYEWLLHAVSPIEHKPQTGFFSIECPNAALRGNFFSPTALTLNVKKGFPVEPVNRYSTDPVPADKYVSEWTLTATPANAAKDEEFVVALQVQRLGASYQRRGTAPQPAAMFKGDSLPTAHAISTQLEGDNYLLLFRRAGATGALSYGGVECDGDVVAIRTTAAGAVRDAFMHNATYLRYRGTNVMQAQRPATLVHF